MKKDRTEYKDLLLDLVSRIDEPQAVANLVIKDLAEHIEWCPKWEYKFHKPPQKLPHEKEQEFINEVVVFLIKHLRDIIGLFDLWHGIEDDTGYNNEDFKAAAKKLEAKLLDSGWLTEVGVQVLYDFWTAYYNNLVANGNTDKILEVNVPVHDFPHISYDPSTPAPHFYDALEILGQGNKHFTDYLQWALGSSITGQKTYSNVFYFYRPQDSAIDWLLELVSSILGKYAIEVYPEAFVKAYNSKRLLQALDGKRMLFCKDFPDGGAICIYSLKCLCEYENIVFYRRSKRYHIHSQTNVFISSSGYPKIKGDINSFLRRVRPIIFPPNPRFSKVFDSKFIQKIRQEKEGVFAWLVEGAKKYLLDTQLEYEILPFEDFANQMKAQWIEEMKKSRAAQQNKKPLPTRKGQTNTKTRQ